ncbi:uncharacterized protein [Aristolochia californica]|uniref:uncharacterized protein n=1 Tax=Aristolochia californica TaxID=171875 RepID=UPI0035DEB443
MGVQEEGRLVMEQGESAIQAMHGKGIDETKLKGKGKIPPQAGIKKDSECFFCKMKRNMKKECVKFQKWLVDKDCIKRKQTNKSKKGANRSSTILEIVHTDICSPDMDSHGHKYFISFIDDYSRYVYLYMLYNKNEALDAFKIFKVEVETQCSKEIKIMRSDRGGEYYGRYPKNGQVPRPFAKFLQDHGIVAQYTMPSSLDQNGVAERRNRTLLGMWEHPTRNIVSEKDHLEFQPSTSSDRLVIVYNTPQVQTSVEQPIIEVPEDADDIPVDQVVQELPNTFEQLVEPHTSQEYDGTTLRRSTKLKRSVIFYDYVMYLRESDYNIGAENDPKIFSQAMSGKESELWYNAMKDEMNSMKSNEVLDLVKRPSGFKVIGYKWNDLEREQIKDIAYASTVRSLMYVQVYTRPDIAFAVRMLGRYQSNPGLDHWRAAKKVMRNLQGTKDYMLMYRQTDNLEVIGYSDSDFSCCIYSRKSTSGYIFLMANGAISWKNVKQTLTAMSTMEVKLVSYFEATSHGVWLKSFISRLRIMYFISRPLRMYYENSAVVFMAKNNNSGSRSKHIDIKYLAIRERIKEKKVVINM